MIQPNKYCAHDEQCNEKRSNANEIYAYLHTFACENLHRSPCHTHTYNNTIAYRPLLSPSVFHLDCMRSLRCIAWFVIIYYYFDGQMVFPMKLHFQLYIEERAYFQ